MHFTSIAVLFLFACIAYTSNTFAHAHNQELSPRGGSSLSRRNFLKIKKKKSEDPSILIERFINTTIVHATVQCVIATKRGAFDVYKPPLGAYGFQVGEERNSAVVKVIQGTMSASATEMKNWAQDGDLLAYAKGKSTSKPTTYLILKVQTLDRNRPPPEKAAMYDALNSESPSDVNLGAFAENFVWTWVGPTGVHKFIDKVRCWTCWGTGETQKGRWKVDKIVDWKGSQEIGGGRLTGIPWTEVDDSKTGIPARREVGGNAMH